MLERLERLVDEARKSGISRAELSRRARLSSGYVSSTISKVRENPEFTPDLATLRALARAAGVSLRWLETGEGDPRDEPPEEDDPPRAPVRVQTPPGIALVRDTYPDHLIALLWAFKRGDAYEPEDVLAALTAASSGRAKLPADQASAVDAMGNILRAARRLRLSGAEVTTDALLWALAGGPHREPAEK